MKLPHTEALILLVLIMSCALQIQAQGIFSGLKIYCKSEYFRHYVKKSGCDSRYVGVQACLGTCWSYTLAYSSTPFFRKVCTCCKPTGTEWKTFTLDNCAAGVDSTVRVESATGCTCKPCS